MSCSEPEEWIHHIKFINSSIPLQCHKPELSSIISKQVVHNYLDFISVEKIFCGIDIKGIVTSYIWKIKGVFLSDLQFDELF